MRGNYSGEASDAREISDRHNGGHGETMKMCKSIFRGFQPEPRNRKMPARRRFGRRKKAEPNSITDSERRLSNWYAPQFFADTGRRETDEQCHLTGFADFKALEELLELQAGERACLAYMERNGSKGRAMEYLRMSVDAREIEIRNRQADDR